MNIINNTLIIMPTKTCNISYNFQSTLMSSPVTLPVTEPTSPQASYTITSGMFPTLSGDLPLSISYIGFLLAGCINNNASTARTLNWRIKRNGTGIGTGSQSIAANNRGVLNFDSLSSTNSPQVGDSIGIYLWCTESSTDIQLNRYALGIVPMRFKPVNDPNKLLMFLSIVATNNSTLTNFTQNYGGNFSTTLYTPASTTGSLLSFYNGTVSATAAMEHPTYGVETNVMDTTPANSVIVSSSAYTNNTIGLLNSVSWRETNIRYNGQ